MAGRQQEEEQEHADEIAILDLSGSIRPSATDADGLHVLIGGLTDYGIVRLDAQGIINAWSEGAQRIKGFTPEEILGKNYAVFFTDEDRASGFPTALLEDARAGKNTHKVGWRLHKDGHRFWGEVSLTALYNDHGDLTGYVKLVRDLSEHHDTETASRRNEELYQLLVRSVVDYAIICLDVNGLVETWNQGAERIKGYLEDEIVGRHFSVFYSPEDQAADLPAALLEEAKERGHADRSGWRIRKNGSRFWSDIVVTALRNADNTLVGFVKITRDLSERHAAQEAAEKAMKRAGEASAEAQVNLMRSGFMESISHDLRTPLTAIKGYAHLLGDPRSTDAEQRKEFLRQISAGADRLNMMVDDLLELTKLESGTAQLRPEPVLLQAAAATTVSSLLPVLGERHVDIQLNTVLCVDADGAALHRILVNLIGNAAKFTPGDSTITIAGNTIGNEVVVSISDNGPGVADANKEAIFQRFCRGGHTSIDGSGIGLSMVRDYVGLHGGRVWVEDVPGGGARFLFTLPAHERTAQEHAAIGFLEIDIAPEA